MTNYSDVSENTEPLNVSAADKAHQWRICPIGKHYVKEHPLHIPSSRENPEGHDVKRRGHCADNPSHHDILSYDELQLITQNHFSNLIRLPSAGTLTQFPRADEFDRYIGGWVQYWNDIFKPEELLDPNSVKTLIASESSFRPESDTPQRTPGKNKVIGHARGLMQLTESTWRIISGQEHTGEIKDHFIFVNHADIIDPSANICVGVRWLFTKKTEARERLHRMATWDEAIAEYKGVLEGIIENTNPDPEHKMQKFHALYTLLSKG